MIPATIPPSDAAAIAWDAVVVGAGPAGASAALRLARSGRRVLLVERSAMPRPKVCGCCLSPRAGRELAALGIAADGLAAAIPLATVRLIADGHAARIAMRHTATLSREALDTAVVRAAIAAGVHWLPHTIVRGIEEHTDRVAIAADTAEGGPVSLHAAVAVVAAGLADAIRVMSAGDPSGPLPRHAHRISATSRIGLGTTLPAEAGNLPAGELVMATSRAGYVGVVRLEDGRIDVAAAIDRISLGARHAPARQGNSAGPAEVLAGMLAEACGRSACPLDTEALARAFVRATPALTRRAPVRAGIHGRVLRIGDAAAYVEPFTGEGIGWALSCGRLVAEAIAAAPDAPSAALAYERSHRGAFAGQHRRCLAVATAVRHPRALAGLVSLAGFMPRAAATVLPWVTGGGCVP